MLGITALYVDDFSTGSAVNRWTSQITDVDLSMSFNEGDIFDQGGLNITMADGAHFSDSGSTLDDLMNTSISNGERREISQISLDALILAHGYVQIPEPRLYGLLAGALALGLTLRRRR